MPREFICQGVKGLSVSFWAKMMARTSMSRIREPFPGSMLPAVCSGKIGIDLTLRSFAVPFEEDERDPKTFFLDLDYVQSMWGMFKKVNGGYMLRPSSSAAICLLC
jgi:hypothetical protein